MWQKKTDIEALKHELKAVKSENEELKKEIKHLNARIDVIDKRTRTNNIIVNGLIPTNNLSAQNEFVKNCKDILGVEINICSSRLLRNKKSVLFILNSYSEVQKIMNVRNKFKDRSIFVQKDYTIKEQHVRFKLRKFCKDISNVNKNIKVRLGEFCVYVDNKKFSYNNESFIAYSYNDKTFIDKLLNDCKLNYEIIVNNFNNVTNK